MDVFIIKKLKVILIVFFILQLESICFSDVYQKAQIIYQSAKKLDVLEFGLTTYPFFNDDFVEQKIKILTFKNSGINFGYKIHKDLSAVNLKIEQNQSKNIKYSDNNKNDYLKLSFDYGLENKNIFNLNWESKIKLIINGIYNQKS